MADLPTRRALLGGAVALPALAAVASVPAVASADTAAWTTAIARYDRAEAAFNADVKANGDAEARYFALRGGATVPVGWVLAAYNRPRSRQEVEAWIQAGRPLRGIDGPYSATRPEGVAELRDKLIGRVVGILEPAFAEPLRLVGEARR